MPAKTLIEVVQKVILEDKRCAQSEYAWLLLVKVLKEQGFKSYIEFSRAMPSPESIFRARRDVMNRTNKFSQDFIPEDNVSIEEKDEKNM